MSVPLVTFTPAADYREALGRAAGLWQVDLGYWDVWGRYHEASPEVLRAILESLGAPAGSLEELNRAVEERLWREWTALAAPVEVTGEAATITLRLPVEARHGRMLAELRLEGGERRLIEAALGGLEPLRRAQLRGREFLEVKASLGALPLGRHQAFIRLEGADQPLEAGVELIVAPDRAYLAPALERGERRAGLSVSLYSLRSEHNWGCGDFTDLERLAVWLGSRVGAGFILLNPLHAIHNRHPFNTSPYLPNSIFYRNFIYLDVERIEDFQASAWARALRASPRVAEAIRAAREAPYVDYEQVAHLKRVFLKLAFREFLRRSRRENSRGAAFQSFVENEGELLDRYAVYCALDEWLHRRDRNVWTWPQWPPEYQEPESEAVRRFAASHWRSVLFHKYVQWQIDLQLERAQRAARASGLSLGLMHDLALATDSSGSDLWAHRELFVSGCRVGAPPDEFSPRGQDWGFPPPNAERHRQDAYRLFQEAIRKCARHGGALRIDHVMRFFRLFWIPEGRPPAEGTYVRDRSEDLLRLLALESVRHRIVLVGEDLGTVEPEVRRSLDRFGILGYRVFYFEKDAQGEFLAPDQYPVKVLVSSTTHDLPTLAGFWTGRDIEARRAAGVFPDEHSYHRALAERRRDKQKMLDRLRALGLLPAGVPASADQIPELTGELHNAVIGFLTLTPSLLLAINQEDLTKDPEQQNLPGTVAQYPNWRHKMRYSLEELESSPEVAGFVAMLRHWLERTGRIEPSNV